MKHNNLEVINQQRLLTAKRIITKTYDLILSKLPQSDDNILSKPDGSNLAFYNANLSRTIDNQLRKKLGL